MMLRFRFDWLTERQSIPGEEHLGFPLLPLDSQSASDHIPFAELRLRIVVHDVPGGDNVPQAAEPVGEWGTADEKMAAVQGKMRVAEANPSGTEGEKLLYSKSINLNPGNGYVIVKK